MKTNYQNISLKPFSYIGCSVSQMNLIFLLVLLPQLAMLFITKSVAALFVILAATLGSVFASLLNSFLAKQKYNFNLSILLEGILIGMLIPETYSIFRVFFIVLCSMYFLKYVFGGLGGFWANSIAITVAIAYFCHPDFFPEFRISRNMLIQGGLLPQFIGDGIFNIAAYDSSIAEVINSKVLSLLGISIPDGYISLFWDTHSVIPAFRFNLLTLFASLILIAGNITDYIIPYCYIIVYALCVFLFGFTGIGSSDILFAILTSGTLFCTFFLLQWYGTTPLTTLGKFIYGIIAGILAFIICGYGYSPIGTIFTIIVLNVISPIIQLIEEVVYSKYSLKKIKEKA